MTQDEETSGNNGCLLLVAAIVVIGLVQSCWPVSDDFAEPDQLADASAESGDGAPVESVNIGSPDRAAIDRAARHAGRVIGALGTGGAEKYSELCYQSLENRFSPSDLDRCYAFDLFAKRLVEGIEGYTPTRFLPARIQARWVYPETAHVIDGDQVLERRTAVESAVSLTNAAIIYQPAPRPDFILPVANEAQADQAGLGDLHRVPNEPQVNAGTPADQPY